MSEQVLAIDVSNTIIALGVYCDHGLCAHWSIATHAERTADEYAILITNLFNQRGIDLAATTGCVMACVVPPLVTTFQDVARRYLDVEPLVVSARLNTGMRILTEDPRELGADRIANAVAARRLYGTPAIVIDFGTATTFDAISAEGDYLGNAIAPGLGIAADALFRQTARLPRVELIAPPSPVGTDTVSSIQSGLIYGYVGLVEGVVARLKAELGGNPHVIATGEQCGVVGKLTPVVDTIDPDLTLAGLRILYDLNRGSAAAERPMTTP
jgi:type III pantothenate kinase